MSEGSRQEEKGMTETRGATWGAVGEWWGREAAPHVEKATASQPCGNVAQCGHIFHFRREVWNLDFIWNLPTFKCWELTQIFSEKHCAGQKIGICSLWLGRNSYSPLLVFPVGGTLTGLPHPPVFLLWWMGFRQRWVCTPNLPPPEPAGPPDVPGLCCSDRVGNLFRGESPTNPLPCKQRAMSSKPLHFMSFLWLP